VLRGSGRSDGQPLPLFSAVSHRLRLTLAQVPIEEKSNKIPALQRERGRTQAPSTASWCRQMTASAALALLDR